MRLLRGRWPLVVAAVAVCVLVAWLHSQPPEKRQTLRSLIFGVSGDAAAGGAGADQEQQQLLQQQQQLLQQLKERQQQLLLQAQQLQQQPPQTQPQQQSQTQTQQQQQPPPQQPPPQQQQQPEADFEFLSTPPYTLFAPRLDMVWSRGWYNAQLPPAGVPIDYYNARGLETTRPNSFDLYHKIGPKTCGYLYLRNCDVGWWAADVLPRMECSLSIITSDGDQDTPSSFGHSMDAILNSPNVERWYAQNVVSDHPKLVPIPIGISIHDGFDGSPHSVDTAETLRRVAKGAKPFAARADNILYDRGTYNHGGGTRRDSARTEATSKLAANCKRVVPMPRLQRVQAWGEYASHKFAISVTGEGWDTHRLWELLYLGTVPIVKAGPLDRLLLGGRLPVVIVNDWSEVCRWTDDDFRDMAARYESWIRNSRQWLYPWHWVPRNRTALDNLCRQSPTCAGKFNL